MQDQVANGQQQVRHRIQRASPITCLLFAFLVLGILYSIKIPILEALDEVWHFAVIHHILQERQLPIQPADPAESGLWRQQGSQPPLYYLLGSVLVAWADIRDFPSLVRYNPHASGGHPEVEGNKNILLHWPEAERWPYRKTALAVHVLRLYSLLLGTLTIYGVYRVVLRIWPACRGLACLAAAFVAFNPQFLFIHAGVINDALAITLCTWTLERLVRMAGLERPLDATRWRDWVLIGALCGLAILSKLSAALLLPLTALLIAWLAFQTRKVSIKARALRVVFCLSWVVVTAAFVSGWWFWRNWQLYGEPTGLSRFIPVAGARMDPFSFRDFLGELEGLELSYWAVFGWFSILADPVVYLLIRALDRLAILGIAYRGWQFLRGQARSAKTTLTRLGVLGTWFILLIVALYRWTVSVMGTQGRLLFPGVASVGLGLALGLGAWLPKDRRWRTWSLSAVAALLALLSLLAPFRYIAPAYRRPDPVPTEVKIQYPLHLRYGDWGELVGYDLPQPIIEPGDALQLTLYWRALRPIAEVHDLFIHLRDADGQLLGQLDTWPGWGMYPTLLWQPDEIVADRYRLALHVRPEQPLVGRIEVGFCCNTSGVPFSAYDPQGREVTPVVGRFKLRGTEKAQAVPDSAPRFADQIALAGWTVEGRTKGEVIASPGKTLMLSLEWTAVARPLQDYTVFVHLVGDDPHPLAQADGPPQEGRYPTLFWEPGERIRETRTLEVPKDLTLGRYWLLVGLYRPPDGPRLPLQTTEGSARYGDAYRLPVEIVLLRQTSSAIASPTPTP